MSFYLKTFSVIVKGTFVTFVRMLKYQVMVYW